LTLNYIIPEFSLSKLKNYQDLLFQANILYKYFSSDTENLNDKTASKPNYMSKIEFHPILEVPVCEKFTFQFEDKIITCDTGITIAAALHRSGFPVHSHSLKNRERSLQCGIGKCGACEMLVDGEVRRICITKVDGIREVRKIPHDYLSELKEQDTQKPVNIYKTTVAIIGAGPAGLACREELLKQEIDNIVIDNNDKIGGQFVMQTHQFFFFEREKKFGGMRGFDIAKKLAGDNHEGIFLNSTVWDVFEGKRIAVKNISNEEIYYVDAEYMVVATGATPSIPPFENDDLPGVYTAAVVQKMMNSQFTLLGKNVLTVGAGNVGYLTSYQLMQAGANVKAIIEAQPFEGGFPVQASRVRRLGIPILTSHILLKAVPNESNTGITGAVVADCKNFKPIAGTEKVIEGIDVINICTGLFSDNLLITKGNVVFGKHCYGAGDATRIGEGTSAVLRGRQVAFEILQDMGEKINYDEYLTLSKEYIDSQQHPIRVIQDPIKPTLERINAKPFVQIDCLYSFACNPCEFACTSGAITKTSTSNVPLIDFDKCTGCMDCVNQCPGQAIFGYVSKKDLIFLPFEYFAEENEAVFLVDNHGKKLATGVIEKILKEPNKTNIARIKAYDLHGEELLQVKGFIVKNKYPEPLIMKPFTHKMKNEIYVCHCEDVSINDLLSTIGDRKLISIDEIKHITRLGAGACRGQLCIGRLKSMMNERGITITGDATPRGPLSNQLSIGELIPRQIEEKVIIRGNIRKVEVPVLIAGGGLAGSSLFRYFAEAGYKPTLLNYGRGSSWRNIAAGRAVFGDPGIADIARHNLEIFKELQEIRNINFRSTRFVNFIHNEALYKIMENSRSWSGGHMIENNDFTKEISPYINPDLGENYLAAFITPNCWQATPGLVIDLIRQIGIEKGGIIYEDCQLIDVRYDNKEYVVLVKDHEKQYIEYHTQHFVNALGYDAEKFAKQLGIETGLYPVKHQAFITRRLPELGINGQPLDMLIDRDKHRGFTNFYGQQLLKTGQIIGCAEPIVGSVEANKDLKVNTKDFIEVVSEKLINWIPQLSGVGFQAVWAGYYIEPRMIVDPEKGLLVGLQGSGFMFSQYLAKMYVDKLMGKEVPSYFEKLKLTGV
jgi:glycine/D-amino acid oxidase-like deaminating enzyme/thioredoxin reductase/Fe-S-cluster-containing hydrogenase component 2/bacterioferritin-associated ferredoxin